MKMPWNVPKLGCSTLVFTVDMPVRCTYRDAHSGMRWPNAAMRRICSRVSIPHWAWNVGLLGRPHDLGNISKIIVGASASQEDYIGWLGNNFDPSISLERFGMDS